MRRWLLLLCVGSRGGDPRGGGAVDRGSTPRDGDVDAGHAYHQAPTAGPEAAHLSNCQKASPAPYSLSHFNV